MLALLKFLSKIAPRRFNAAKQNELTKVLMRQRRNGLLAQRQSSGLLIHWSRVRSPHNPPLISCILSGSLAQLVEQRTLNPLVAGSNPSRPTIMDAQLSLVRASALQAEGHRFESYSIHHEMKPTIVGFVVFGPCKITSLLPQWLSYSYLPQAKELSCSHISS